MAPWALAAWAPDAWPSRVIFHNVDNNDNSIIIIIINMIIDNIDNNKNKGRVGVPVSYFVHTSKSVHVILERGPC